MYDREIWKKNDNRDCGGWTAGLNVQSHVTGRIVRFSGYKTDNKTTGELLGWIFETEIDGETIRVYLKNAGEFCC
jgi:hypothetical protein